MCAHASAATPSCWTSTVVMFLSEVASGKLPWEAVLFSDETTFSLDHSDGRIMVYRMLGERYQDAYIRQRRAFGGGSVMVWGSISAHGRTPLVIINGNLNAHRYPKEVVRPHVLPFVRGQRRIIPLNWLISKINSSHARAYSISQEIYTPFLLCCALLWLYIDWFSHIHQAYFTGTVAI